LAQIVRLEQYYESDALVLGLVGQKAQLFEKFGINKIDDALLEDDVTVRVSVGLGAGDPMQRLQKFQSAAQIFAPLAAQTKEFQSGQVEIDWQAIADEVFGAVGYHDGGKRFFKINPGPAQNPMADLKTEELRTKIAKDQQMGKAAMFTGLANLAKVALGKRDLETCCSAISANPQPWALTTATSTTRPTFQRSSMATAMASRSQDTATRSTRPR